VVKLGVPFEPNRDVMLEPVMTADLVEEFRYEARDFADVFDVPLTAQLTEFLRKRLMATI